GFSTATVPSAMSSMVSSKSYSPLYGDMTPTSASSSGWPPSSSYPSAVSAGQVSSNYQSSSLSYHQQPTEMTGVYSSPAADCSTVSSSAPSAQQASPQLPSPGHHHGPSAAVLASLSTAAHQSLPHH